MTRSTDMESKIVIIGAGQAAAQAIVSLRQEGYDDGIVLVGDEPHLPYQRPPLSKAFLTQALAPERLLIRPRMFFEAARVETLLEARAAAIDPARRQVVLSDGRVLPYRQLLLATGGRPRRLDCLGADHPRVAYLRSVADAQSLQQTLRSGRRLAIVGGGYVGLEVAAAAIKKGLAVTLIEAAPRILARVAGTALAEYYEDVHRHAGVRLLTGSGVSAIKAVDDGLELHTTDGHTIGTDGVLAGIGLLPNQELAAEAGVACDNGIAVDENARTSVPDVFAAGDCTSHVSTLYDRHVRLESVQNAIEQAKSAAAAMCGKSRPQQQVPWFWSDQYDLKLQTAGLSSGHDEWVIRGDPASRSFSVFYLLRGRLIAVDAVNRAADFAAAVPLIASRAHIAPRQLADERWALKDLACAA